MESDYELLYLASENNEEAINMLYNRYKNIIHYKAKKYSSSALNFDDYLNEANLTFYEVVKSYNEKNKFSTYLNICLERRLQNYKKEITRKKNSILNNATSYDNIPDFSDNRYNPEIIISEENNYEYLKKKILKKLNSDEELVFLLKEQDYSVKEISNILDKKIRTIYNRIATIRKKIYNLIAQ